MSLSNRTQGRAAPALLLAAFALGGCALGGHPRTVETDFPIAASREPYLIEVPVSDKLDETEARRVEAFARRYRALGEGELTVAYPQEGASKLFVADVIAHAHTQGVKPGQIVTGAYAPSSEGERGVVLSFYAADALKTPCPSRWTPDAPNPTNDNAARFGCATQTNVAAMLERPRDLAEPRPLSPADLSRRSTVLDAYRAGKATQAEETADSTETTN